ncbi:MAG: baseplate J/gp47 family protein [Deltaproteobacteria bacterium]|jgi:uncharacterized phage protein gp47/JayE|nr:baseplate J/gp47 family protein [Deltaproteobacteria bacterium]
MPFNRPSLADLATEAQHDLAARLGAFGRLRRNVIDVLARVWAGLTHGLYGYIAYLAKQMFPQTAETYYLDRHSSWWGIYRKSPARARGLVIFTGIYDSEIPAGAVMADQSGNRWATEAGGRIGLDETLTLLVRAEAGGTAFNLEPGVKLNLISPYSGVNSEAEVGEDGVTGGAGIETDAELRSRLLERVQEPPQGGTEHDYVAWAKAVDGVTRAWAYGARLGPGTVSVTFVCDGQSAGIIPSAEKVAEVQAYLDDPVRRPITADVIVYAPVASFVDVTISGLMPDTDTVRDAVVGELQALFTREGVPGGSILLSHCREVISQAAGEYDHVLVTPTQNLTPAANAILTLGDVTFVE